MSRKKKHATHANHERWLVSYADFITLLFAFFVVLYSSSQVDQRRVGKLATAIQVAFQELGAFPASSTQVPIDSKDPLPFNTVQAIETAQHAAAVGRFVPPPEGLLSSKARDGTGNLVDLERELERALAPEIRRHDVALR